MDQQKEIKDLLEDEIRSEIENLSQLKPGEKAHADAVDSLVKLYKLNIEEIENEREFRRKSEESANQDLELQLKEAQLKEQIKARRFGIGVDAAKVVLPLLLYAIVIHKGYRFEETGTITSQTLKGILSKFRPA